MAYLFAVNELGIILDARLAKIRGLISLMRNFILFIGCKLLTEPLLTPGALIYEYIRRDVICLKYVLFALITK